MNFHPYSEAWRLLKGADFDALVADIKENGLREKIWLYQDQILDGRNRYRACERAGIKPKYRSYTGPDPISFVISLNKHRRHDNENELAFAAARIANMRPGQRTDLGSTDSRSIQESADEFGTSRSSAVRARRIMKKGSAELQEAAESGDIALAKAAAVVDLPKSEQLAAAKNKPEPEKPAPDIKPTFEFTDDYEPEDDEEYQRRLERVMASDDRLAAMREQLKQLQREKQGLQASRDHYQSEAGEAVRLVKKRDREIKRLKTDLTKAWDENESLRERIAIMEEEAA